MGDKTHSSSGRDSSPLGDAATKALLRHRRGLAVLLHALLAVGIYVAAFLLRFDGQLSDERWRVVLLTLPFVLVIRVGLTFVFNLHCGLWRYAGMDDLVRILKAYSLGSALLIVSVALFYGTHGFPRSVFLIDWGLGLLAFGGVRFSIRLLREWLEDRAGGGDREAVLIAGAGDAGAVALRLLKETKRDRKRVVGFLDDDPAKLDMSIHGCHVVGTLADAPDRIRKFGVKEVLIAMPSVSKDVLRGLVERCAGMPVRFRILPAIADVLTGHLNVQPIRDVGVEDLLGRAPIALDRALVGAEIAMECVLVTGAAGSIGSEIARQVAAHSPRQLVLLDMAESPLFEIDRELARLAPDVPRVAVMADVKNAAALDSVLRRHRPHRIFHAAAYKHVPLMQDHPIEAAENNVFGTLRLARAAARHGVRKFVMISTDKAVRPCNVMGATKRVAELIVSGMNGNGTRFVAVRFGNVLGSNGSVIPIFKRQIATGGPVTVTHPEMTRFFMTIPEAVELVLQAGAMGEDGDMFVLDMGEQIRIRDLAENLIRLSGLMPGHDIRIEYVGLRPGEKLSEELAGADEDMIPTSVPKLNVLRRKPAANRKTAGLDEGLAALEKAVGERDEAAVRRVLFALAGASEEGGEEGTQESGDRSQKAGVGGQRSASAEFGARSDI